MVSPNNWGIGMNCRKNLNRGRIENSGRIEIEEELGVRHRLADSCGHLLWTCGAGGSSVWVGGGIWDARYSTGVAGVVERRSVGMIWVVREAGWKGWTARFGFQMGPNFV